MESIKKQLKQDKGSITMTVLASMLLITSVIVVSYFSIFNQGSNQNKNMQQISEQYEVTDAELKQKYQEAIDRLKNVTTMSLNEARERYMFIKDTNTKVTDEYGNAFVVPAGFKVTDEADNVTKGIVIQDNDENEFVWIPVGEVKYVENSQNKSKMIKLDRYYFERNGTPTVFSLSRYNNSFKEETEEEHLQNENKNAIAKDINDFINKVNTVGGYYIGRYEAGIEGYIEEDIDTKNSGSEPNWTGYKEGRLVEKKDVQVFNYVTQIKASEVSKNMYESNENFECDLVNSYAWDTAILFLQEFSNEKKYSNKTTTNYSLFLTGNTSDKVCNVYDMASNCWEWDTETSTSMNNAITRRGGCYNAGSGSSVQDRYNNSIDTASYYFSFRPILYIK